MRMAFTWTVRAAMAVASMRGVPIPVEYERYRKLMDYIGDRCDKYYKG